MKRRSLATLKAIWRDQIANDRQLTPATFKVGYMMADFITMKATATHYEKCGRIVIFPSKDTIKKRSGISHDTIREAVRLMIRRDHLKRLSRGNQFTGSNQYEILLDGR